LPRRVAGRWAGTGCRSLNVSTGADVRPWIGQREVPSLEEIIEEERGFFLRTDSDADQRLSKKEFIKHFLDSMGTRNIMGTRAQLTKLLVFERTSGVRVTARDDASGCVQVTSRKSTRRTTPTRMQPSRLLNSMPMAMASWTGPSGRA